MLFSGVQHSDYTYEVIPPNNYNTRLAPYVVTRILLSIFPVLYFTSTWLFHNYNLYFSISSSSSPSPPTPFPSGNHQFVLCIYKSVTVVFVHVFCSLFFKDFYLFIFRERGKWGRKTGRETSMCGLPLMHHPTGDLARNPGMCPDWGLNWWPFGLQVGTQSTEPHQPGQENLNFISVNDELRTQRDVDFHTTSHLSHLNPNLPPQGRSHSSSGSFTRSWGLLLRRCLVVYISRGVFLGVFSLWGK